MEKNSKPALALWGTLTMVAVLCGGCDPRSSSAEPQPKPITTVVPLTNMVAIKPGSFMRMGRRITLSRDYWLGRFEVTQGEYWALTGKNPSHFTGDTNRPVDKVTQADAVAYCVELTRRERLNEHLPADYAYRLPTEAEWEYACRAGSTNAFSFGDDAKASEAYAWTEENSDGSTHPVGQKLPNAWGLHDMHGNVWEWCRDWFAEYPPVDEIDPVGPSASKFKVFRGGGWNHQAKFARCSNRFMMPPANGIFFVGFRVALGPVDSARR